MGVTVFGLGPDSDVYNYPQWTVTSIRQDDDPNSDADLLGLRAKIASVNNSLASDLYGVMETYITSINTATTAFASYTASCWLQNAGRPKPWNCPRIAFYGGDIQRNPRFGIGCGICHTNSSRPRLQGREMKWTKREKVGAVMVLSALLCFFLGYS